MRVGDVFVWHSYPRQGRTSKIIHGGPQGSTIANDDNASDKVLVLKKTEVWLLGSVILVFRK